MVLKKIKVSWGQGLRKWKPTMKGRRYTSPNPSHYERRKNVSSPLPSLSETEGMGEIRWGVEEND